jgi:hypothetical protein
LKIALLFVATIGKHYILIENAKSNIINVIMLNTTLPNSLMGRLIKTLVMASGILKGAMTISLIATPTLAMFPSITSKTDAIAGRN